MNHKGFTILELLIVVAIIGILTGIVLASLNNSRSKGGDSAVKADLANTRSQASLYFISNNNYGTMVAAVGATSCTSGAANTIFVLDTLMANQISAAKSAGSGIVSCLNTLTGGGAWAVTANLKTDATLFWCVDSAGVSKLSGVASPASTQTYADSVVAGAKCN